MHKQANPISMAHATSNARHCLGLPRPTRARKSPEEVIPPICLTMRDCERKRRCWQNRLWRLSTPGPRPHLPTKKRAKCRGPSRRSLSSRSRASLRAKPNERTRQASCCTPASDNALPFSRPTRLGRSTSHDNPSCVFRQASCIIANCARRRLSACAGSRNEAGREGSADSARHPRT